MINELRWIRSDKYGGKYVLQCKYPERFGQDLGWQDVPYEETKPECPCVSGWSTWSPGWKVCPFCATVRPG